jgi:hypothetical protein
MLATVVVHTFNVDVLGSNRGVVKKRSLFRWRGKEGNCRFVTVVVASDEVEGPSQESYKQ